MAKRDFQAAQEGERTNPTGKPVSNKVLLSVFDKEYRAIRPHLEFLSLPRQLSLYQPNGPLKFVYFPNAGMVSLVIETEDGRTVEVGEVGKEGFAGIPAAVGTTRSRVSHFMNKFRTLGFIAYAGNGVLTVNSGLMSVVLSE